MEPNKTPSRISTITTLARLGLAAAIVWLSAASTASAASRQRASDPLPKSLEQKVKNFQAELTAKGYEVARGEFHLFTIDDCKYAVRSIGNCLGNNPAAPYVIPSVPHWSDEFVDEHMKDLLGPIPANSGWTYRLDEREAIVVLAQLPPAGRYFGIQPYIFSREGRLDPSDPIYKSMSEPFMKSILFMTSPNPSRPLVFSSIGNSINNVVIERQSGAAFDQERFFIMASDANFAGQLSDALLQAGVPDRRDIFTAPVPPSFARLGLGAKSDDFVSLIRYTLPKDEAAGEKWRHELPLAIFRVRHKDPAHVAEAYPMQVRETRTARSELGLQRDLDDLVTAVKQKWGQADAPVSQFQSLLKWVDLTGDHCIARPMNCLGDTGDADYQVSETTGIDHGELLAVAGTLGTATGNATYTSLAVNQIPELVGTFNLSDPQLKGTASGFSSKVGHTDKLYLTYFARDCSMVPNCHPVTEQMVPRGGSLKVIQRNYVVPGSTRGPAPDKVLNPKMILLKRP